MTWEIELREGDRVEAKAGEKTIVTDQDGSAPQPFDLFLASIGTCAGFYVSSFCRKRGIDPGGIRIRQSAVKSSTTRLIERLDLEIRLPPGFPERYRDAVLRAANLCSVKKHLERPPEIRTYTSQSASI